ALLGGEARLDVGAAGEQLRVEVAHDPPEVGEGGHGVERTVLGVAGGERPHQLVELDGQPVDRVAHVGDVAVDVLVGDLDGGRAGEGLGSGEHLVQEDAGGV